MFSISAITQDGSQNSKKSKHFRDAGKVILSTPGVQNLPEISLSLTVLELNGIFKINFQNIRQV